MARHCLLFFISVVLVCRIGNAQHVTINSIRVLSANVGNVGIQCWESKLCDSAVVTRFRNYIETWNPDVVLLSEVYRKAQLDSLVEGGPILPSSYSFDSDESIDRNTNLQVAWDAPNSSHEHECIAWQSSKFTMVPNSSSAVFGRNDSLGSSMCNYDFTAHSVKLIYNLTNDTITFIALHPNSMYSLCRIFEINEYWNSLALHNNKVVIAGDWNTDSDSELQVPSSFTSIFSKGHYWNLFYSSSDFSQTTFLSNKHLDHAFSNFGQPCISCGSAYGTGDLAYGAALGGYQNHPRADGGSGMDHRQILFDINISSINEVSSSASLNQSITVFPNPASNYITIDFNLYKNNFQYGHLEITDMYGVLVLQKSVPLKQKQTVPLDQLNAGVYTIKVYDRDINNIFKGIFIKQ